MSEFSLIAGITTKPILPRPGEMVWVRTCWCSDEEFDGGSEYVCRTCGAPCVYKAWTPPPMGELW